MRLASIISDPKRRREWSYRVLSLRRRLSVLLYIVGIGWLFLLPTDDINGGVYIDENALMPGYASVGYDGDWKVMQLAEELKQVTWEELPQWISSKFSTIGLEVFTQNFTVSLPVMVDHKSASVIEGVNLYSVLPAAKTSSSESIVLAVMVEKGNLFSLAMLINLAEYFSTKPFWAKDLIFVVTTGEKYGMQAWLESYLGIESSSINKDYVIARSGIIQAAVVLEVTSPFIQHVSVLTNGINGQLSNQDIGNTAVLLLKYQGIVPSFHGQVDDVYDKYLGGLKTMLRSIGHQATGLPEHLHGLFVRYHIDAVTLQAHSSPVSTGSGQQIRAFGRAIEGTIRSINNLLEPLHHSFFFYLPVSSFRYVSISIYFPPLGCVFIALMLEGLAQWLLARDPQLRTKIETGHDGTDVVYEPIPSASLLQIGLTAAACGYLVYVSPMIYSNLIGPLTPTALLYSIISSVILSMIIVPFVRLVSPTDWHMVKFFYMLLLLTALLAISLLNFSLSLMISVGVTLPCLYAAPISSNGLNKYCLARIIFTLLLSPSLIFLYYSMLYMYMFKGHNELSTVISHSTDFATVGLTELYLSSQVLGSWVYVTVLTCVWPLWLAIWSINFQ